ncbi:52 kDa repressor of the inhibitor of the protein kinase-like [Rhopalosiphum padi]|uniref:52 kDa repressor of the inhibitor of the protein kinase-like n=1 Tax=Rhopalosiphum padi TaxID=40932 RepID=UPI00298D7418|nr:52 kDa repressor of the inhibitor of the protein kinase-like [Rhopalosiphum padi]XP_060853287.1 52 kDa repressor of the inhibitor of the protein kinase-like [Rhopalosiphum padi]
MTFMCLKRLVAGYARAYPAYPVRAPMINCKWNSTNQKLLSNEDPKVKTLKRLCATRWVQRYDAVTDFIELFVFVVESLENISNWNDSTSTEANILLKAIDSEFLISLQVIQLVFSFGLPLCKLLQKEQIDLKEAVSLAEDIINVLKNIRLNCDTEFHKLFLHAKEMSVIKDIDLSTKRISKRQVNRATPDPNLSVEEYHKVSVFIPYLDFFLQQLGERFSIHSEIFKGFQSLFSYTLTSNEEVSFRKLLEFYSPSLDVNNSIAELKLWKIKLERINNIPKTAIEALHVCNANIYPNVHFILKILCTLPVSTSTPERMFSSLKRIKTYLRNTMSEKRLNGLAMLAIHNDIIFSNEEVIDELAKKPRNLDIIL